MPYHLATPACGRYFTTNTIRHCEDERSDDEAISTMIRGLLRSLMVARNDRSASIRIPIFLILKVEIPVNVFRLAELVESFLAEFARAA